MEDLIKKANDIVEVANKPNRKENAYGCLSAGIAFAGLMMGASKGDDRLKAIDAMMETTIKLFAKEGFAVRGKPKEFEAKFKMTHLRIMFEPINSSEDIDKIIREEFDEHIWNICLFDTKAEA